ncbi:Ganglioside-induced differentiation-associated protein 2, partial [Biomphalaria glabrata]
MEVLGQRHELVEPSQLTRWNFTKLLEQPKEYDPMEERSPFPWRNDLNAKIVL